MNARFLKFLLVSFLIGSSIHASDLLTNIENVDEQFFEQQALEEEELRALKEEDAKIMRKEESASESEEQFLSEAEQQTAAHEPSIFSEDRYQQYYEKYMDFIGRTDANVYKKLKDCEKKLGKPCLTITNETSSKVTPPTEESHGYPLIFLEREQAIPEGESYIEHILKNKVIPRYKKLATEFYEETGNKAFYYVSLIKDFDQTIHKKIQKRTPECFRKAAIDYTGPTVIPSHPYPLIIVSAEKPWFHVVKEDLLDSVKEWYKIYQQADPDYVPAEERMHFLEIIQSLAPELYTEMITIDPTGMHHIERHSSSTGATISPSSSDGLPVIAIGTDVTDMPLGWQRFIIGHELGHYALSHFKKHSLQHKILETQGDTAKKPYLSFKDTFEKASNRIQEYEADRFSALILGTSASDAIAWRKARRLQIQKSEGIAENPRQETFTRTHPQDIERIKHLKSVQKEIELQKAHVQKPTPIDWKALIELYKKSSWNELQEAL